MKTRLQRISPASVALFLASVTFIASLIGVIFTLTTPMKDGVTVTLSGFSTFTFHDRIDYFQVAIYPFINTISALVSSFIFAWIYNIWARLSGGIEVQISDTMKAEQDAAANP